jgi:hypothetical protein
LFTRDFKIRIIEGITNPDLIVHIRTLGWSYDRWRGVLYPHQLPSRQEFDRYIQHYQTVEVNSTYYRWPPNAIFAFLAAAPPSRISDERDIDRLVAEEEKRAIERLTVEAKATVGTPQVLSSLRNDGFEYALLTLPGVNARGFL